MIVSYTIRQEQDQSAETAPLIEEAIQEVLDVSTEISSLNFYQTLFKNTISDSFSIWPNLKMLSGFLKK